MLYPLWTDLRFAWNDYLIVRLSFCRPCFLINHASIRQSYFWKSTTLYIRTLTYRDEMG
jgi:hypothetical protein